MKRAIVIVSLGLVALGPAATALAQGKLPAPTLPSVPDTQIRPATPSAGPYVRVPDRSTIVADVHGGGGEERAFRSQLSFGDAVKFYDEDFKRRGTEILSRTVAPDGVHYRIRHEGKIDTVDVLDTNPTTIDIRERI